jgi:RNA polymerase sigma-B factor
MGKCTPSGTVTAARSRSSTVPQLSATTVAAALAPLRDQWRPRSRATVMDVVSTGATPADARAYPNALLLRLGALPPDDPDRSRVRNQVIEWYLPMATFFARRFDGRGQPVADLTQVAVVGLIMAVDRYDITRGVPFTGFAIPTILGEIKRHFRDTAWNVRVPRRMQELTQQLAPATDELIRELRRAPTTAELAARMGISDGELVSARRSANAYRPLSLERMPPDRRYLRLIDALGRPDPDIEAVERRETLRVILSKLSDRDRRIIVLRYVHELTQSQIAADIGLSQMQISRLLARSLTRLRSSMDATGIAATPGLAATPDHIADLLA